MIGDVNFIQDSLKLNDKIVIFNSLSYVSDNKDVLVVIRKVLIKFASLINDTELRCRTVLSSVQNVTCLTTKSLKKKLLIFS